MRSERNKRMSSANVAILYVLPETLILFMLLFVLMHLSKGWSVGQRGVGIEGNLVWCHLIWRRHFRQMAIDSNSRCRMVIKC